LRPWRQSQLGDLTREKGTGSMRYPETSTRTQGEDMASEHIVQVSDADFDQKVINGQGLTIVDFWAEWCAPCRMIAPILEDVAQEYAGKVTVAKLNVDENPQAAARFGIRSIPTLLFFKGGERVDQVIGAVPRGVIQSKLGPYLD
jgi:thioredoxin 1